MRRGPKPRRDVLREPNGRISRTREGRLIAGTMVYTDYAVYFAQSLDGFTKIGFSGNLQNRMSSLTTEEGDKLRIVALALVQTERLARKLEKIMHKRFVEKRDTGEWFVLSDGEMRAALADCRRLGIKTVGLEQEQATGAFAPFSSLIDADKKPVMQFWAFERDRAA
jgi:hypothetical protein